MFALVLGTQAVVLAVWVALRIVNADEGILLQAARRVAEGERLYRDVFSMQPPLTTYLFAPFAGGAWPGFFAARIAGMLATLALTAATMTAALGLDPDRRAAAMAGALLAFNGLTLAWHPTATTLPWADALGAGGIFLLAVASGQRGRLLAAGVLLGLAASARLTHGVLGVVALLWLATRPHATRRLAFFGAGALVGGLPLLVHLALSPAHVWLDTVVFRQTWGLHVVAMPLKGTLKAIAQFVLYPQNLLAVGLALASRRLLVGDALARWQLMLGSAGALAGLYAVVTPTQTHYFAAALPFLCAASAPALASVLRRWRGRTLALSAVLFLTLGAPYALLFIGGIRDKDRRYRLSTVAEVVGVVRACTAPTDSVLAFNQHTPVLAGRPAARGLEVGGVAVVPHLDHDNQRYTGLLDEANLRRRLARGEAPVVVYEPTFFDDGAAALTARYRRVFSRDSVSVYVRHDLTCARAEPGAESRRGMNGL